VTEELLNAMMGAIDPARNVSDAVLAEVSPEEHFWTRIESDLARVEVPRAARPRVALRWTASVAAIVVVTAVLLSGLNSPARSSAVDLVPAQPVKDVYGPDSTLQGVANGLFYGAAQLPHSVTTPSLVKKLPLCRQSDVAQSLAITRTTSSTQIWHFVINLRNSGASCRADSRFVTPDAVTGPDRLSIYGGLGIGPYLPLSQIPWRELAGHSTTHLVFEVLSPLSRKFMARQRMYSKGPYICSSLLADGFVEAGLNASWTYSYFHLPYRVPVCREGLYNVWVESLTTAKGVS
jgi:hypothetical protein